MADLRTQSAYKTGKPKAKLVPYEAPRKRRVFGQNLLGITYMADDWDGPLPPEIHAISTAKSTPRTWFEGSGRYAYLHLVRSEPWRGHPDPAGDLAQSKQRRFVSAASVGEIAIKKASGKLEFCEPDHPDGRNGWLRIYW